MISVRISPGLVQRLDEVVDAGVAATRAELISRALEREFRRISAERDAELLDSQ
ncbi:MAG: antitoxin, partial [Actinomycetales bacterium]